MKRLKPWIDKYPITSFLLTLIVGLMVMAAVYKLLGGEPQNDPVFLVLMWVAVGGSFIFERRKQV